MNKDSKDTKQRNHSEKNPKDQIIVKVESNNIQMNDDESTSESTSKKPDIKD